VRPTPRQPLVTLLTDYGLTDEFVGLLHGVIACVCPQARVIDLSHGVPPQDVRAGAALLVHALPFMPVGVHVAVVDPTVGSERRAVALRLGSGRILVGPDNGLLWPAAQAGDGVQQAVEISASPWRLEPVAATFHGRDIFAPVAAHLAAGEPLEAAGEPLDPSRLVRMEIPPPRIEGSALVATVIGRDRFGNLQLAAVPEDLDPLGSGLGQQLRLTLPTGQTHTATLARTFSDVGDGELLLFEDASRQLALACNGASAEARLGLRAGEELRIGAAPGS
jgi:S-adenosylmethionine hydrolase